MKERMSELHPLPHSQLSFHQKLPLYLQSCYQIHLLYHPPPDLRPH